MDISAPDEGCIHIQCPRCDYIQLNRMRYDFDPPTAVLFQLVCRKCMDTGYRADDRYLDSEGTVIVPPAMDQQHASVHDQEFKKLMALSDDEVLAELLTAGFTEASLERIENRLMDLLKEKGILK